MEEMNERFPMNSEEAAKMAASTKEVSEDKESKWASIGEALTVNYKSTPTHEGEEEALISASRIENQSSQDVNEQSDSLPLNENFDSKEDDYSYFNTIYLVKKSIHLIVPTTLMIFAGSILFVSGCSVAFIWSRIISHINSSSSHQIIPSFSIESPSTSALTSLPISEIASNGNGINDEHTFTFTQPTTSNHVCAPWLAPEKRRVVIRKHYRLNDWDSYQNGTGYLGGEGYWSASLMYILQSLGFEVELDNHNPWGTKEDLKRFRNGEIYRAIVDDYFNKDEVTDEFLNDPTIMCRVRHLQWWYGSEEEIKKLYKDGRKVLTPYPSPESSSTTTAFFVHSEITLPPLIDRNTRGRTALLLDKQCAFSETLLLGLLDAGYELYLTCFDPVDVERINDMIPAKYKTKIHQNSVLTPKEFSLLLRKVSIVVGFGNPRDSPTPLEGLANGAAFLNPTNPNEDQAQHAALKTLGPPYVYNYVRSVDHNVTLGNILKYAEIAIQHPFGSYIPFEYRFEVVRGQICANLIEADNVCECLEMNEEVEDRQIPDHNFCEGKF